jgi:hypothetical protein
VCVRIVSFCVVLCNSKRIHVVYMYLSRPVCMRFNMLEQRVAFSNSRVHLITAGRLFRLS